MSRGLTVLVLAAALTALMLGMSGTAWATTFAVTNTADSGKGSLRQAISDANSSAGADTIEFADGVGGTIILAAMLPHITDPEGLTIDGGGDVTVKRANFKFTK